MAFCSESIEYVQLSVLPAAKSVAISIFKKKTPDANRGSHYDEVKMILLLSLKRRMPLTRSQLKD